MMKRDRGDIMSWTKQQALEFTLKTLKKQFGGEIVIIDRNIHGHAMIRVGNYFFYFIYKKSHLNTFNRQFLNYVSQKNSISGLGESINKEYLLKVMRMKATLLFTYMNYPYAIYKPSRWKLLAISNIEGDWSSNEEWCDASLLLMFCGKNNLIRKQDKENEYKTNDYSGNTVLQQEVTYCFPIKLLERLI